jgi:hypothetical protein
VFSSCNQRGICRFYDELIILCQSQNGNYFAQYPSCNREIDSLFVQDRNASSSKKSFITQPFYGKIPTELASEMGSAITAIQTYPRNMLSHMRKSKSNGKSWLRKACNLSLCRASFNQIGFVFLHGKAGLQGN